MDGGGGRGVFRSFLFLVLSSPFPQKHLGPVPRKVGKFNPGLSQFASKVFLSKNMSLELTKCCWPFSGRF